jgi:hypothetical protein
VTLQPTTRFAPIGATTLVVGNAAGSMTSGTVRTGSTLIQEVFWNLGADTIPVTQSFLVASDRRQLLIYSIGGRELSKPIRVLIECINDNEFIAAADGLNMAMPGETIGEAFGSLRSYISDIYSKLLRAARLGPEPTRQRRLLEDHFGKEGRKRNKIQGGN